MKNKINQLKQFLLNYLEDFLIFMGLLLIIIATFLIKPVAGLYATGLILLGLGIYFVKFPINRKGR